MTEQIRFDGFEAQIPQHPSERNITCCFTGHRDINETPQLYAHVRTEIEAAYNNGYRIFRAGGALGFDTVAALNTLALRESKYPDIRLELVLPYPDHHVRWNDHNKKLFTTTVEKANKIEYVSEHYTKWCMFARNRRLVEESSLCICYMTDKKSGTGYTVDYAKKNGLKIINLAD